MLWAVLHAPPAPAQEPDSAPGPAARDLLHAPLSTRLLPLYVAKVPIAMIELLQSDAEATAFAELAWGQDKPALHVDFSRQQVLALAWGPQPFVTGNGRIDQGCPELIVERAVLDDDQLHVTVRTVLPLAGHDGPVPERTPRTWYPCAFLPIPHGVRIEVDVMGARCRDRELDFRPVADRRLSVRVQPDAMPSRHLLALTRLPRPLAIFRREGAEDPTPKTAGCALHPRDGGTRLEIDWGELDQNLYTLQVVGAIVSGGTARLTVRADVRNPAIVGGPTQQRPALGVDLPPVDRVLLTILRTGERLELGDDRDFQDQPGDDAGLQVTVDRRLRR